MFASRNTNSALAIRIYTNQIASFHQIPLGEDPICLAELRKIESEREYIHKVSSLRAHNANFLQQVDEGQFCCWPATRD